MAEMLLSLLLKPITHKMSWYLLFNSGLRFDLLGTKSAAVLDLELQTLNRSASKLNMSPRLKGQFLSHTPLLLFTKLDHIFLWCSAKPR